jgi:hypothetical protein
VARLIDRRVTLSYIWDASMRRLSLGTALVTMDGENANSFLATVLYAVRIVVPAVGHVRNGR